MPRPRVAGEPPIPQIAPAPKMNSLILMEVFPSVTVRIVVLLNNAPPSDTVKPVEHSGVGSSFSGTACSPGTRRGADEGGGRATRIRPGRLGRARGCRTGRRAPRPARRRTCGPGWRRARVAVLGSGGSSAYRHGEAG